MARDAQLLHVRAGDLEDAAALSGMIRAWWTEGAQLHALLDRRNLHDVSTIPASWSVVGPAATVTAVGRHTANFGDCSPEEVVNAYDNSILYTDKVLEDLITLLSAQDNMASSLLYLSDHGESLGENGLYLHGAPYFMAPEHQTKVPMLFWQSQAFAKSVGIDDGCLRAKASAAYSHDHLFHSLLGLTGVDTAERAPELDIFAGCGRD